MTSLLVTNDFPPKIGGIQSYLWELWRRLPPDETTVLTTPYDGDRAWDRAAAVPRRAPAREGPVADARPGARRRRARPRGRRRRDLRGSGAARRPDRAVAARRAGGRGPPRRRDHGARRPAHPSAARRGVARRRRAWSPPAGTRSRRPNARRGAPLRVARRAARDRHRAASGPPTDAASATRRAGTSDSRSTRRIVLGASRLVPRKGFDVLIDALGVAAGRRDRRDRRRWARPRPAGEARRGARPRRPRALPRAGVGGGPPVAHRAADVFAMLCRDRWGGLEAEGFGIVFLEAGRVGPRVRGRSVGRLARGGARRRDRVRGGPARRRRRRVPPAPAARRRAAPGPARAPRPVPTPRRSGATTGGSSRWPRLAAGDLTVLR